MACTTLDIDEEKVVRLYEEGNSANWVAKRLGFSLGTILKILKAHNVVLFHNR